jgi:hypothetical protein
MVERGAGFSTVRVAMLSLDHAEPSHLVFLRHGLYHLSHLDLEDVASTITHGCHGWWGCISERIVHCTSNHVGMWPSGSNLG